MKADSSAPKTLLIPIQHLLTHPPDIVIIGSGPAGVAVAEFIFELFPEATVSILERGDVLTLSHVNNVFPDEEARGPFINAHGTWPWEGYFKGNGMMMFALGGRGIVAGGHLRRFDRTDFELWKNAKWPIKPEQLDRFYTAAEIVRNVSPGECESRAQTWVMGALDEFNPHPPPWGIDVRSTGSRRGLDSSVQRLCELIHRDCLQSHQFKRDRRLLVTTNTQVTKILLKDGHVTKLVCQNLGQPKEITVAASTVILAASTVESAKLMLKSNADKLLGLQATGRYLAEHILCRTEVVVPFPIQDSTHARVNAVVPPPGPCREPHHRFQIDVRQSLVPIKNGKLQLRISGFAAMDPNPKNRVELAGSDINTTLDLSHDDHVRIEMMKETMKRVARRLGAHTIPSPNPAFGRSNHEVGTLRMGRANEDSVTDATGKVHGVDNLFVADASVFPCVGVANPMLTITALAYRLAQHVGRKMKLREKKDPKAPWSLC